jgi:hypothetical protein
MRPQLQPGQSQTDCDAFIQIISQSEFDALTDAEFSVIDVSINQDCLSLTIGDSGCDPENWNTNLLTTDAVLESNPVQKNLKIEVVNNELCGAVFEKIKTIDLTPIQNDGDGEIILNIEGWPSSVSYEF